MARTASEKKDAVFGNSCTTANANTKSTIASRSTSCMDAGLTTRASILSKRPALRARRFSPSIIRGCTSTATTRPKGPTSLAISTVKKPMPGPGSSTVIPEKARRIGVLLTLPPSVPAVRPQWQALVDGLREHGWEEGRNLILEGRFTGPDPARYPELAAELVALKVDAIIAGDSQAVEAARHQTATIPIIMLFTSDPVRSGFVASLARPGGNITGLSGQFESLVGKTLELLKEVKPTINRVGILFSPDNIGSAATAKEQQEKMAPRLGLTALPVQQLAKFQLVINLKTARAIGLDLPESLLLRADEVIE